MNLTPFEISLKVQVLQEKQEQEQRNLVINAWYTEAFARMEKLTPLEDLFKDKDKKDNKNIKKDDKDNKTENEKIIEIAKRKGLRTPSNF